MKKLRTNQGFASKALDELNERMNKLLIDSLTKSIKTQKKFVWLHYFLFFSAIILGPLYLYSGNYFSGSVWTFNLFMNGWFIYLSNNRVKKYKVERLEILKSSDKKEWDKIVRKKKFKSLGIS